MGSAARRLLGGSNVSCSLVVVNSLTSGVSLKRTRLRPLSFIPVAGSGRQVWGVAGRLDHHTVGADQGFCSPGLLHTLRYLETCIVTPQQKRIGPFRE